jgi:hypothetical protein
VKPPTGAQLNAVRKRHGPGPVANRSTVRTELAIRYDTAADKLVQRAIRARGATIIGYIPSTPAERRHLDDGLQTASERAFGQACHYHRLIYMWAPGTETDALGRRRRRRNPDRRYSLPWEWGDVITAPDGTSARQFRVRVKRIGEASLWAKGEGWTG